MFEKVFSVPYYGLDARGKVKTGLLLQFFQEAAAMHADSRKIGVADLLRQEMTWVLRRYRVRFHARAGLGDLSVRTWYEPQRNLTSVRVFEIRDMAGNVIGDAWSGWIVVDLARNRPVRLDRALPPEYYAAVEPTGESVKGALEGVGDDFDLERNFRTRWQELDMNGHTNHTVYFDWAMESVPDNVPDEYSPIELDAEYLVSAQREKVTVRTKKTSQEPLAFAHSVTISASGAESARLSTTWRKIEDPA